MHSNKSLNAISILFVAILLSACNNHGQKQNKKSKNDTTQLSQNSIPVANTSSEHKNAAQLKSIIINEKYFNRKTQKTAALDNETINKLHLQALWLNNNLESNPGTKIKIIDTLLINSTSKLFIVSAESENEHWAWLVVSGNDNAIKNQQLVFYEDFVEYFFAITTKIADTTITITTKNNTDTDHSIQVEKYIFTNDSVSKLK